MLRRGRPVSVNKKTLEVRKGKDYAELMFWGDVHYGYPTCLIEEARANLDYCFEKRVYVIGQGDLLESGLTDSIGDSVYHQKLNPQEQMEDMISFLEPLAKKGLLLGLMHGN